MNTTPALLRLVRLGASPRAHLWQAKRNLLHRFQAARAALDHQLALRGWKVDYRGRDRTAYVIGLFGTGRWYVNELLSRNLGRRAIYFRDGLRYHPAPTSMIYSGHATLKHPSWGQRLPELTNRLLEQVRAGAADLIFVYRHPLDSLLSNWVWLRGYIRYHGRPPSSISISQLYRNTADLCAELEGNFAEFKALADGDPSFSASLPGPRFLSFAEFVEETTLFVEAATLSLRLEDFMVDPLREFGRMARAMSDDVDLSGVRLPRPKARLYRYRAVAEGAPRFRRFINELDAETRRRIERLGYEATVSNRPANGPATS